jgi:hypothetical protein
MSLHTGNEVWVTILVGNVNGRNNLGNQGVEVRIILKWILLK